MFALEYCSLDEDLKLQGCASVLSVLFYSHALLGQTRESRRISSCRAAEGKKLRRVTLIL
jgi:hypothetical protein